MPRRFHTKSRFGCTECKVRRVKCDEGFPVCGRCMRNRCKCHYPLGPPKPGSLSPDDAESGPSPSPTPGNSSVASAPLPSYPSTFDLLDLTLMYQYATHTCQHLFVGERESRVWQYDIPALAAFNIVLMHGFLAITALHRARDDSERRDLYRARALHHHEVGLPLFQDMVASAVPDQAEVIVAYSVLLGMWIYAFPEIAAERPPLDEILGMIEVVRSARSVFHLYRDVVMDKPVGQFLIPPERAPLLPERSVARVREAMQALHDEMRHPSDVSAASRLQKALDQYLTGADHARSAANWMASVDEEYWVRLRNHKPYALLVFSYSSLLIRASEHDCWWMTGWSERILRACNEVLSPKEKQMIDWNGHIQQIRSRGDELADLTKQKDAPK